MNIKEEHSELIDAFLRRELDGRALQDFEALIASHADLAKELEIRKKLDLAIRSKGADDLRSELDDIFNQNINQTSDQSNSENPKKSSFWKFGFIALLALLLASIWYFMKTPDEVQSGPSYYAEYFEAYDNVLQTRGEEIESLQEKAMSAYENKRYDIAIPLLAQLAKQNEEKSIFQLYLGISLMEQNEFEKATEVFSILSNGPNTLFHDHANWYNALNYIKPVQIDRALPILKSLAQNDKADFSSQAQALLRDLN